MLRNAGGRQHVLSISMCLSADLVNTLCRSEAITCASVRGNLPVNYRYDYGIIGVLLAWAHLFMLRWHDLVVAMNTEMASQISRFVGRQPFIIGNFVDEIPLEYWRVKEIPTGPLRLVFLGTLTERKQPLLFVHALGELKSRGNSIKANIIGEGPERNRVTNEIKRLGLEESVMINGFLNEPASILSEADVMILPSLSEGISRAALEALFLGVPTVLRAVEGNSELIHDGINGALFSVDDELPDAIIRAVHIARQNQHKRPLLLDRYRQIIAGEAYLKLIEKAAMNSENQNYFNYLSKRSRMGLWYRRNIIYRAVSKELYGRVLDVGCGIGDMLSYRANTVGVDINPINVNYCRNLGLNAIEMEINRLPFGKSEFDGVILDNVLEHITDSKTLLAEIYRVLKPNSILVVGVPGLRGFEADADHKIYYDKEKLQETICNAGFETLRIMQFPLPIKLLELLTRHYYVYGIFTRK
jgi:SAM-dependent methyltransferase